MGTKAARKSEPTYCTAVAPSTEPAKAPAAGQAKRRRSTCPARQKVRKADPVPIVLCSLFVASAATGGTPAAISAGIVRSPPPPAIASTVPATKATAIRKARSEEHTSELQSLMRHSYAVFCLKKTQK